MIITANGKKYTCLLKMVSEGRLIMPMDSISASHTHGTVGDSLSSLAGHAVLDPVLMRSCTYHMSMM